MSEDEFDPEQKTDSGHSEEAESKGPPHVSGPSSMFGGSGSPPDFPLPVEPTGTRFGSRILSAWKATGLARGLERHLRDFEPMQAAEWASRTFQSQGTGFYGRLITTVLCAYFLANLTALLAGKYIPDPPLARVPSFGANRQARTLESYGVIFARNIFNSKGLIPGEENVVPGQPLDMGGPPVRTTLPFNLVGTLILTDELRSIGTIEDKAASQVYPVRVDDEIPTKAKILKVEYNKVTFVNTATGKREFIDIPEDANAKNTTISLGPKKAATGGGPGIEKVGANQFNISRSEVDKSLSDLNQILTQARAVPNFENGLPAGYKLFQIVPGSIYAQLGLQNGDVIAGLDGAPINDPGKAFEMLSRLKEASHLELQIKREGRPQSFAYDIR